MKKNILLLFVVFIIVFLFGITKYISSQKNTPNTSINFNQYIKNENNTPKGPQLYSNSIIGLSFTYPEYWKLQDSEIHGDENGTSYCNFLFPPNWNTDTVPNISICHSPISSAQGVLLDNQSIDKQIKAVFCDMKIGCELKTNMKGVRYIKFPFNCLDSQCSISAIVPTGKYIMTFTVINDNSHVLENTSKVIGIFDALLESIELR